MGCDCRLRTRDDRKKDRETNIDTFGVASARRRGYYRGRGFYNRGYQRGGQGGGYYNNRCVTLDFLISNLLN